MARYMIEMEILWAALGGFCLDLLLGDPAWMPHPVVLMGRCIELEMPTERPGIWREN